MINKVSFETMQKCRNLQEFDKCKEDIEKVKEIFIENPKMYFSLSELCLYYEIKYSNVIIALQELIRQNFIKETEDKYTLKLEE